MSSTILNFEIEQGQTWDYEFLTLFDPCDKLIDLSGYSFGMQIRKTYAGEIVKELTTENGGIIVTNGNWLGDWNLETEYKTNDIVRHDNRLYICETDNVGEEPYIECGDLSDFWLLYRQVRFIINSDDSERLAARKYIYNLEVYDLNVEPRIESKLLRGNFVVKPEVTI